MKKHVHSKFKHFATGAALALLVVAAAPAGANYFAQVTGTYGDPRAVDQMGGTGMGGEMNFGSAGPGGGELRGQGEGTGIVDPAYYRPGAGENMNPRGSVGDMGGWDENVGPQAGTNQGAGPAGLIGENGRAAQDVFSGGRAVGVPREMSRGSQAGTNQKVNRARPTGEEGRPDGSEARIDASGNTDERDNNSLIDPTFDRGNQKKMDRSQTGAIGGIRGMSRGRGGEQPTSINSNLSSDERKAFGTRDDFAAGSSERKAFGTKDDFAAGSSERKAFGTKDDFAGKLKTTTYTGRLKVPAESGRDGDFDGKLKSYNTYDRDLDSEGKLKTRGSESIEKLRVPSVRSGRSRAVDSADVDTEELDVGKVDIDYTGSLNNLVRNSEKAQKLKSEDAFFSISKEYFDKTKNIAASSLNGECNMWENAVKEEISRYDEGQEITLYDMIVAKLDLKYFIECVNNTYLESTGGEGKDYDNHIDFIVNGVKAIKVKSKKFETSYIDKVQLAVEELIRIKVMKDSGLSCKEEEDNILTKLFESKFEGIKVSRNEQPKFIETANNYFNCVQREVKDYEGDGAGADL